MSKPQKITIDDYGSFVVEGPLFQVVELRGPVSYRQDKANELEVKCYLEAHLNSFREDSTGAFCIAAYEFARTLGESLSRRFAEKFQQPDHGVRMKARGYGLVSQVRWPAPGLVLEPGFLSNPDFVSRVLSGEGQDALGWCVAEGVRKEYPNGGLIGLSIGHAYRGTGDMGAPVHEDFDEDPEWDQEAEIAEGYVRAATEYLVSFEPEPATQRNT